MSELEQRVELLEAFMKAVKVCPQCFNLPEQPATPKPRCDAQGRLLEAPALGTDYFVACSIGVRTLDWSDNPVDEGNLEQGSCFISQPAAEAEITRLKCLQRLRGMEGYTPHNDGYVAGFDSIVIIDGFDTELNRTKADATITPEERAAFLYREPNHV
jgi:hypothetical protein